MDSWRTLLVSEIAADTPSSLATGPFGSAISSKFFSDSGVPVIRGSNLSNDVGIRINEHGLVFVSETKAKEFKRSIVRRGDLVFTCWGTVDQVGLIDERASFDEYVVSNKQMKLTPNPYLASALFLYYFFSSPAIQATVRNSAIGSSVPGFNLGQLRDMPVLLPPLPEQMHIAHILGTLDDKIELNRQMNQTLDEIARTLFRSWFVDFDPVRDKAEGRQPDGMDAETAALFPDRLVDSELGPIPEGWHIQTIGELVRVVGGSTPSTKEPAFWEGGSHLWVTPKDLSGMASPILIDASRRITDAGVNQISSRLLPVGAVLLSSRAPVGYLAITTEPTAINQGFIGMICDRGVPNFYMLNWARENIETIKGHAGGTTFAEISKTAFRPIRAIQPEVDALRAYGEIVAPLYELIESNLRESQNLAEVRDTLLPELLSGRLAAAAPSVIAGVK